MKKLLAIVAIATSGLVFSQENTYRIKFEDTKFESTRETDRMIAKMKVDQVLMEMKLEDFRISVESASADRYGLTVTFQDKLTHYLSISFGSDGVTFNFDYHKYRPDKKSKFIDTKDDEKYAEMINSYDLQVFNLFKNAYYTRF